MAFLPWMQTRPDWLEGRIGLGHFFCAKPDMLGGALIYAVPWLWREERRAEGREGGW